MGRSSHMIRDSLSDYECLILRTYAQSSTGKEAAEKLNLKVQTFKNYMSVICSRLGVTNARQAIWDHYILGLGRRLNCHQGDVTVK